MITPSQASQMLAGIIPSPVIDQAQQVINARFGYSKPVNIASSIGAGVLSSCVITCPDEGECILSLQAHGYNSNGTIVFLKSRGTQDNPEPVKSGDILGLVAASGWQSDGRDGGSPGSAAMRFEASENFSMTGNGTAITWFTQHSGTTYPAPMQCDMGLQDGVLSVTDHFRAKGAHGVDWDGAPTANFQVRGGIVTRG